LSNLVDCTCSNPECDNIVRIPRSQKRFFLVDCFKRYGIIKLPYCCKECQETHQQMLAEKPGVKEEKVKAHDLGNGLKL
jgi:hypothetical protein